MRLTKETMQRITNNPLAESALVSWLPDPDRSDDSRKPSGRLPRSHGFGGETLYMSATPIGFWCDYHVFRADSFYDACEISFDALADDYELGELPIAEEEQHMEDGYILMTGGGRVVWSELCNVLYHVAGVEHPA